MAHLVLDRRALELSGFDGSGFFQRHVQGTEPLPLAELARVAGLELVVSGEGSERSVQFLPLAEMTAQQQAVQMSLASR